MAGAFLTGNVTYRQDVGVVDVQTIMDNLGTLLVGLSPAWTRTAGNVGSTTQSFQSPVDGSGRQFSLTFNRIAATNLEMVATDGQARSVTRRAQIAVAGSTINYYASQFHMVLDWLNGATPEGLFAIMLDESPESQTSHNAWLVVSGARNTSNTNDSNWNFGRCFCIRNGNTFQDFNVGILPPIYHNQTNGSTDGFISRTVGGSNIWCPIIQMGDVTTLNVFNIYGKYYNCLNTKDTFNPPDTEISVPIDQATSAIFRVLNSPAWAPGGIGYHDRMAVRKG